MLRKLFSLGALVVVAVTFGVSNAAAKPNKPPAGAVEHSHGFWSDGFSDGRFI
jgi:invasion protein IalB